MKNMKVEPSLKMKMLSATILMALTATAYAVPSRTAQGNYVEFTAPTELAIEQNIQYRFDDAAAALLFTNTLVSGPVATCKGNPTICATAPTVVIAAPAVLASQVAETIKQNKCIFLNGGTLSGSTYTQSVDVNQNWTYTWTYAVTPTTTDPIAAKTAWVYDRTLGGSGTADVDVSTMIAGESVVVSSQFPAPGKYSFSLLESDGVTNRVQNLKYTVTDTVSNTVTMTVPGAEVPVLQHGAVAGVDLIIKSYNGGEYGVKSLLWGSPENTSTSQTLPQSMSWILNHDYPSNNDNGGAGGLAMSVDVVQPVTFTLPPSTYNINLSGVVKGNSTSADQPFTLTNQVHITYVGSGCGQ
jgi:hypothetical protein